MMNRIVKIFLILKIFCYLYVIPVYIPCVIGDTDHKINPH